jgi:hypothetical protein
MLLFTGKANRFADCCKRTKKTGTGCYIFPKNRIIPI